MAFRDINPFIDYAGSVERGLDTGMRIAEYQRKRKDEITSKRDESDALGEYSSELRTLGSTGNSNDYEALYRRMSVDPRLSSATRELNARRVTGFGQQGVANKPIVGKGASTERTYKYDETGNLVEYKVYDKNGDGLIDAGYQGAGQAVPDSGIDPNKPTATSGGQSGGASPEPDNRHPDAAGNLGRTPPTSLGELIGKGASAVGNLVFPPADAATLDAYTNGGQPPPPAQPSAAEQLGIQF